MAWVKKNLVILIAAVISLAALGYAIFFVKQRMTADEEITAQLNDAAENYKRLLSRKIHPGNAKINNIERAKEELAKMKSFAGEMREYLKGPDLGTNLNNQVFRAQLDTSIAEFHRKAEEANVALPSTNFWFTFTSYKTTVDFKGDVAGLAAELADIRAILDVLYASRVHSIVAMRRVAVSDTEFLGSSDYIPNRQPKTNDWAISTGYEVTFQGFSSELARVMEGLANAKECFVVKSVGVAQAPEERKPTPAPAYMPQPMPMYNNPYDRYRYNPQPYMQPRFIPQQPAATRSQPGALKTILDENKLRFTLQVDSVRLKPKEK